MRTVHIPDVYKDAEYRWHDDERQRQRVGQYRTLLGVPLLREGAPFGAFTLMRGTARPFTDKQIELVTTFANQAVIAIENARLLSELRESLERQTATTEVLRVISSSPGELEPVFQAMLENAVRICEAKFGMLYRYDGTAFHAVALFGVPPAYADYLSEFAKRSWSCRSKQATDPHSHSEREALRVATVELAGARTLAAVPMLREDEFCRRNRHLPRGGSPVHRQADRAGDELRQPGRHRHREHSAAQRAARIVAAADRHCRRA